MWWRMDAENASPFLCGFDAVHVETRERQSILRQNAYSPYLDRPADIKNPISNIKIINYL